MIADIKKALAKTPERHTMIKRLHILGTGATVAGHTYRLEDPDGNLLYRSNANGAWYESESITIPKQWLAALVEYYEAAEAYIRNPSPSNERESREELRAARKKLEGE